MGKWPALILFLLTGCASLEIEVLDYPRDNTRVIIMPLTQIQHEVVSEGLDNTSLVYQRKIVQGQKQPAEIRLNFNVNSGYPGLKDQAKIIVDNTSYDVQVSDIYSFMKNREADFVGLFGVTSSSKILKGRIIIPHEVEQKIISSKEIAFSLSAGIYPIHVKMTRGELEKVKEFLKYNPQ
jgi:hypothetical protein